jgi:hypothetical protein
MTREQAGKLVALLSAAFPHPPMTPERLQLFTDELALLVDFSTGDEAARMIVRGGEWFPKISEFRQAYRSVAEKRRETMRELEPPSRAHEPPTWVQVWAWCRWIRKPPELRALPQDRHGFQATYADGDRVPTYMSESEYAQLEQEWREAGAPKWRSTEILRVAGITA